MDRSLPGGSTAEKRRATLRRHAASLRATTGRGAPRRHGGRTGEGAR
ncbi:DUF6380 family protein [Streptomyces sp. NPDC086766]